MFWLHVCTHKDDKKEDELKRQGSHGQRRAVIREILLYLVEHPDAKDTIDGICDCWLPQDMDKAGRQTVREAIDVLVRRGWLTERKAASEIIYGLNKDRLEEIQQFLRQFGNGH